MENEVKDFFDLLLAISRDEKAPLVAAYRQLRDLLERLCRREMPNHSLQMTDLSARISFVASKLNLSIVEQNRLHTFRLTSNAILNNQGKVSREDLLRDIKTLTFFTKRISHEDIPDDLYRLLPRTDATYISAPPSKGGKQRLRVCYQYSDEFYLYVTPLDEISNHLLRVRYNVPDVNEEFAGTCKLLWQHAQLNLLDVTIDDEGILTPSFIILEPDYLIDISSLAECFNAYGHHPANYLLARFRPSDNTRPLLLGNIANLFLDEWIHTDGEPDYLACMKKAFRIYPIELAACPDLLDKQKEREFFADCKRHFENIRRTVTETFAESGYELDKTDAVLEPSYICEALGLQGRLDYMQRDMSSFIEMKSGKADEYAIRGKVEPKENNKVQMLLYQAVLEYSMGMSHRRVRAYLFYTRYPLLYPARPSWAMVRRVMNVRNSIVANEYGIQLHNSLAYTADKLAEINPETLNEKHLDNTLWKQYLYPSIDGIVQRIKALSTLEQAYFYSTYNFITKELYTSKIGCADNEGHSGASSLWLSTLAEKCESGDILLGLKIKENHAADSHKPYLLLSGTRNPVGAFALFGDVSVGSESCDERHDEMLCDNFQSLTIVALPNFRKGDAVVLYERNTDSDNVTNKMVFKGNIEEMTGAEIRIRLRATQQNAAVLPSDSSYVVEHDYMDTAFRSMYTGLTFFLSANKERRDLLLRVREPAFDLSFDQQIAVASDDFSRAILKAQAAKDYFLLMGPPGTGKTSCALRGMVEVFHREGKQILLLAYTNRAVDEICKAIASIAPQVDFIRIGSELSCDVAFRSHLIENVLESCLTRKAVQDRIRRCRIFIGTVATLSAKTELFRLKTFDVAIIDEASQILEPQLLGLLCAHTTSGVNAIGKFILIGDYKQLPAIVLQDASQSEINDEHLKAIGLYNLRDSLFERFYRYDSHSCSMGYQSCKHDSSGSHLDYTDCRSFDMLCRQGRMHVDVARFPNEAFYGGHLDIVGLPHQQGNIKLSHRMSNATYFPLLSQRVAFIPSKAELPGVSPKVNLHEAKIVTQLVAAIYRQYGGEILPDLETVDNKCLFDPHHTLGIIAPYRSQIALIKSQIASLEVPSLNEILVDTVERFQGSERDIIIYSFCVNRTYQLEQLANLIKENGEPIDRKLNVVLTRARKQIFLTGVLSLLEQNPIYAKLLRAIEHH